MKIVFLDAATLGATPLDTISALGDLVCYPTSTPEEALRRVGDAEVLIVNKVKVTAELMDAAPCLRLICEAATGVNNIDLEAADGRGIKVRNVAGYSTDSVAQLVFCQILSLSCRQREYDMKVKDGSYSASGLFTDVTHPYMELSGKTLGVIGMGAIGKKVACIGKSFGMKVIYFSTSGTSHCADWPGVSLEELLSCSDVISIHAPLNARTDGLVGIRELRLMKRGAILINMARGGIVVEQDLAYAISEGMIGGAAVDVFTEEPIPADHPFLSTKHPERLLLTPHVGWASAEAMERLVAGIAGNIRKGF